MLAKLGRAVLTKPTLLGSALRATLLVIAGFGFTISTELLAAIGVAVEAWLALATEALVTPTVEVAGQIVDAVDKKEADITRYLAGRRK